jgi:hypothetical protein
MENNNRLKLNIINGPTQVVLTDPDLKGESVNRSHKRTTSIESAFHTPILLMNSKEDSQKLKSPINIITP